MCRFLQWGKGSPKSHNLTAMTHSTGSPAMVVDPMGNAGEQGNISFKDPRAHPRIYVLSDGTVFKQATR